MSKNCDHFLEADCHGYTCARPEGHLGAHAVTWRNPHDGKFYAVSWEETTKDAWRTEWMRNVS